MYCANYIPFIMLFATILYHPEKIADVYSAECKYTKSEGHKSSKSLIFQLINNE